MAFDLSILAQPLAHKSNPSDFNNLTNTILNVRQDSRRGEIADSQIGRTDKANEFTDLQITKINDDLERRGKLDIAIEYGGDMTAVKSLLDGGDVNAARAHLLKRLNKLNKQRETDPTINTDNTEGFIRLLEEDPNQAYRHVSSEVDKGIALGHIKAGAKSDVLSDEAFQQQMDLRAAGKSTTSISNTVSNAGNTQEAKALADSRVDRYTSIQDKALTAEEQNIGLSQLGSIDIQTGFGEETKAQAAAIFNAFGVDGDDLLGTNVAGAQSFNSVAGKLVLDVMATQKGPQTDADQARIAKTLPLITNEGLANQFNMNALMGLNFRRIEMAEFYDNFLEEKETLKGVDRAWAKFKAETPMLSDNVKNPETGLPMFFHEFKAKLIERNPGATSEQVINAWRELAK